MKSILKPLVQFFKGEYNKDILNEKIINHINLFCSIKRIDAGIDEVNIDKADDKIGIVISCAKPGKLIGANGFIASQLANDLSVLAKSKVDLRIIKN